MSVFDLLTEEDKQKIIHYIDNYGPLTEYTSTPTIDNIKRVLGDWDYQKSMNLQQLFGGNKLILSRPYTYTMSAEGVASEISEAINKNDGYDIYNPIRSWLQRTLNNRESVRFYEQVDPYQFVADLIKPVALAENAYMGENVRISFADDEIFKVAKGMKPIKIIRKLINKLGDEKLKEQCETFRNWHSQLLNQIHLDGVLSLSIHPLDYMTMSDNGGSWDSCMRWQEGAGEHVGDYRVGTVACMNSPYIIVAYLHNPNKTMEFTNFDNYNNPHQWNKKKWRELFIVQNGIISEIKGYPFQDENLTNTTLMWIKELANENLGWTYDDIEIDVAKETPVGDHINMFRFDSGYMYNDFGSLTKHRARVNFKALDIRADNGDDVNIIEYYPRKEGSALQRMYELTYSAYPTCMCCGSSAGMDKDNRANSVFCTNCEPIQICPCCGEYMDGDGYYVSAYSDPICYSCYDYECGMDDLSQDTELNDSLIKLEFAIGKDKDGNVITHGDPIYTLDPEEYSNAEYDRIFNTTPKIDDQYGKMSHWWKRVFYITYNMAKNIGDVEDLYDVDLRSHEGVQEIIEEHPECVEWYLPMKYMQMMLDDLEDDEDESVA